MLKPFSKNIAIAVLSSLFFTHLVVSYLNAKDELREKNERLLGFCVYLDDLSIATAKLMRNPIGIAMVGTPDKIKAIVLSQISRAIEIDAETKDIAVPLINKAIDDTVSGSYSAQETIDGCETSLKEKILIKNLINPLV